MNISHRVRQFFQEGETQLIKGEHRKDDAQAEDFMNSSMKFNFR